MRKFLAIKKAILPTFLGLAFLSVFLLGNLKFSFDFSQFFPKGDEDLIFYNDFIKDFGSDDNFLLIAIANKPTVFESSFLEKFHQFSMDSKKFSFVKESQSLTTLFYPLKTSFGYTRLPIIHLQDSTKYAADWEKLKKNELFLNTLIDEKGSSMVIALETDDELDYDQSLALLNEVRQSLTKNELTEYHLMGRAFFFEAIVQMQKRELIVTTIISTALVFFILLLVYRRIAIVLISLFSIVMALLLFLGVLSALGKELNALAAFYPILLLIVGTSDVIHIMDSFLLKMQMKEDKETAMIATLKEVGLITLLTSITTAIGFTSLLYSRLESISNFGVNSAIGVGVAYITVVLLTSTLLLIVKPKYLLLEKDTTFKWSVFLSKLNAFTIKRQRPILVGALILIPICFLGISKISTNYQFSDALPEGSIIAKDFTFFQRNYSGFRPLEVAVTAEKPYKVTDFALVKEIEKVENKLKTIAAIGNVQSVTSIFKTLNRAHHLNKSEYYSLPEEKKTFEEYKKEINSLAKRRLLKFVDSTETKARITSRVLDVGADSLNTIYDEINTFVATRTDNGLLQFKLTGKGLLLDKNAIYARDSLLQGLSLGLLMVALLMSILYKNVKLVLISLIPNVLPLLIAGALLGFLGIPLEASISIVFAIVFGIAVDDTIHFLGKYRYCKSTGLDKEAALEKTFLETGRALIITTLTLFFGFMVLLFSIHKPSITIGLLVSTTLLAALILDLLLLPILIRKML